MGNGASMEDNPPPVHHPPPASVAPSSGPPSGRIVGHSSARSSARGSLRGQGVSRSNSQMSLAWKKALKSATLSENGLRKMRAAALGRKSACTVTLNKGGFSLQHIQICEGQVVTFEWNEHENQGFNVTQVTHDGEKFRTVEGGFNSGPVQRRGFFEQQFNMQGEYKFVSYGLRCTPLTIEVYPRKAIEAELSDDGFSPRLIRLDEGNTVHWTWSSCSVPHTVQEMKFSHKTGTLVSKPQEERPIQTKAGSLRRDFTKPGLYYFTTEGIGTGIMHTCIIHVRERQREYKIELDDHTFNPPIILIEEGDRVWFSWDKSKLQKTHAVYQIEPPPIDHPSDESYKPYKNGFKWPSPTRSGLLSAEFFEAGIYYFSDHNHQASAEYIGTIIVKPKQVEHFVELTAEGFSPDLLYASTGDRIWWTWMTGDVATGFNIGEVEKCVSSVGGRPAIEGEANGEGSYMDEDLELSKVNAGLETVQLGSIGVYHYRVSDSPNNIATCSIIVNGGPRNHTVHVTDGGFEPKVVTIHPGDRIWWVWQNAKKPHNVIQVSHQGKHIDGGFQSGAMMDAPSAYQWQFHNPGVYYYISEAVAKVFGAIVVTSQPKVHEVQVSANNVVPDPVPISVNDVVAWTFRGLRQNDVAQIETVDQVLDVQTGSGGGQKVAPRRCMNRVFTEKGVCHFASKSFIGQRTGRKEPRNDETRISSVLVDELSDSATVRVDTKGFHPDYITIKKGQSMLWSWKDSVDTAAHNIVHVNNTSSDTPLSVIQGGKSFNSGRPVPNNSFLYTFDEPGTYCVASQGAPGYAGTIHVLSEVTNTAMPFISSDRTGGSVDKFHVVKLKCNTKNAQIFYTIDGSAPELHKLHTKSSVYQDIYYVRKHLTGDVELYDSSKGVVLKNSGLCFVRAMAISKNHLNSEVFTSQRFWVLSGDESQDSSDGEQTHQENPSMGLWWQCIPTIKAVFTSPGVMEVFWDPPPTEAKRFIRNYNLSVNEVTYCPPFPANHTAVTIGGMAGGRTYELFLQVYPTDPMFLPHKSNKLIMKCPKTVATGGPIISLETTENADAMAIVWMSISTPSSPIEAYRVYLNGQMCGNPVVPDPGSERCKVVIEGCKTDFEYRVVVAAIGKGDVQKMSNEMDVTLPLDTRFIALPPNELRMDDEDMYKEYLEIRESDDHAKKKSRTAVVAVAEDTEHLHLEDDKKEQKNLPAPQVSAETLGDDEVMVRWNFKRSAEPLYRLLVNIVNVVGPKFKQNVTSDISFECLQEEDSGAAVPAVQHIWNVTSGNQCLVKGLAPGTSYTIYVVANYALAANAQQPYEIQAKSPPIKYTTLGPPPPPQLRVVSTDLYQVTLAWDVPEHHNEVNVTGFRCLVNGAQLGGILAKNVRQTVIDSLRPGNTISVQIVTLTDGNVKDSETSNTVKVTCPSLPAPVSLDQQPSYKKGTVTIAWERPKEAETAPFGEEIIYYRVYLDGTWHGEVKACDHCNKNGYQYFLTDLKPGQAYDVTVKAFCGQKKVDPRADRVYVLCDSTMSNSVPVMAPAPPTSPHLRLEGMNQRGIDVTWEMPQQYGDAALSGYQMLKNGKLYGSIIPLDVHQLAIHGISLGERVELQILALTDHPVGRKQDGGGGKSDAGDSGVGTVSTGQDNQGFAEIYIGDRYSACKPGPKLTVLYTGLVQPPSSVWCEQVTGHSALIAWKKDASAKAHYVFPDSYQVTWWQGDKPDKEVNSQSTKDDHVMITGLSPNLVYNVVVEARKMQKYREIQDGSAATAGSSKSTDVQGSVVSDTLHNTFILTAQSERLQLRTAAPPSPATNVGVTATTCTAIQVAWEPPKEHGVDIIAMRVDAVAMKARDRPGIPPSHSFVEVSADSRSAVVENLVEKTEYLLTITAITDEYFEQLPPGHDQKRNKRLPTTAPPSEDPWLPSASVIASTSGTDAPYELKIVKTTVNSVTLTWKPAVVYGSNRLQGTIVRWAEGKFSKQTNRDETMLAHHKSVEADSNQITLEDLNPGVLYKIVVEAVVSVKMTLQAPDSNRDPEREKNNRRTTHVMSKPIFTRTRAPCEPPKPIVTGYTTETISLYWEKPLLYSVIGKDAETGVPKYLKLSLEGYRIEINGKPHMRLASNAQSCTLVKCKPGKTYKVVLVALTCTEEVKKERRKRGRHNPLAASTLSESSSSSMTHQQWEVTAEDLENDDSPSLPVQVTLPKSHDGLLSNASCRYLPPTEGMNPEEGDQPDRGDIQVDWGIQGDDSLITQFTLVWHCLADGSIQKKVVECDVRSSVIPVQHQKCLYNITIEPSYSKQVVHADHERVQCQIPGSPDAPDIWSRGISVTDFVIEWGEPRLYGGVKIKGYQVYINGKKVGNMLNSHHRKAVIPSKPRRQYRVNLHALSSDPLFPDSRPSNTLLINTSQQHLEPSTATIAEETEDGMAGDDDDLNVKVIKLTESTIHLDWSLYTEPEGMSYYRVAWSSVAQPAEREVRLPAGEKSCIIHKLYPGVNHFIRIYAMSSSDQILERSRQITAQTCATPDTPNVTIRAINFKYIAIQWSKPASYGDALVTGFKVFVNGVVEAVLGPDQLSYSYTQGKWCREYIFQVQAVTSNDKLSSKPSEPLVVTWPGVQPPVLRKAPSTTGNSVKIIWDPPTSTEGVKVKQYKLICIEEESERPVQIISPIHPDTCEADLHNLKQGTYLVYVETHLHTTSEVIKSDILKIRPTITPDPPTINVTVIGLEERRQMEKVTCDLLNKRDRLLNILSSKSSGGGGGGLDDEGDMSRSKAAESLAQVEEMLDDCLVSLNHYTGHLLAHVSWTAQQSNPDVRVTGYKVLVDGKQYGTTLHAGVKHVRIKLGLGQPSHRLSMVSVCDRPHTTSMESNMVELLTEPFLPFTFYSFLSQAPKGKKSSVAFQDVLALERKQSSSHRPINQGLLKRKVPPPACSLMDIFDGDCRKMFPPSGPNKPTAVLFWAKWCTSSQRILNWFVQFAREFSSRYEFIAVACSGNGGSQQMAPAERAALVATISENGWREDSVIRHVTSHSATSITLMSDPNTTCRWHKHADHVHDDTFTSTDMCEIFGVQGVPSILIVHPEDYIAWKGRYCANDYASYKNFLLYVFAQSMKQTPSGPDPWDSTIDTDAIDGQTKRRLSESQMTIHRPMGNGSTSLSRKGSATTTINLNGSVRPPSGKKLFHKSNKKQQNGDGRISVNARPFSASSSLDSPYQQKLTASHIPRRTKSGRKASAKNTNTTF